MVSFHLFLFFIAVIFGILREEEEEDEGVEIDIFVCCLFVFV